MAENLFIKWLADYQSLLMSQMNLILIIFQVKFQCIKTKFKKSYINNCGDNVFYTTNKQFNSAMTFFILLISIVLNI